MRRQTGWGSSSMSSSSGSQLMSVAVGIWPPSASSNDAVRSSGPGGAWPPGTGDRDAVYSIPPLRRPSPGRAREGMRGMTSMWHEERLYIDGELVEAEGGKVYDNVNPATGEVIGVAADASADDLERAISAARRAFDETDWSTNVAL